MNIHSYDPALQWMLDISHHCSALNVDLFDIYEVCVFVYKSSFNFKKSLRA